MIYHESVGESWTLHSSTEKVSGMKIGDIGQKKTNSVTWLRWDIYLSWDYKVNYRFKP